MRRRLALIAVSLLVIALIATSFGLYASGTSRNEIKEEGPTALLLVTPRQQTLTPGSPPAPRETEIYRQRQAAMLKSEFVLNAALRTTAARNALKSHADPLKWLAEHLMVENAEGSEVLKVRVTGLPKGDAAAVVNAVVDAYQKEAVPLEIQAGRQSLKRVEDARRPFGQRLSTLRDTLASQAQQAGLPTDAADHRAAMAALYQERSALRVEAAKSGKSFKDELTETEGRIRRAEEASAKLDALRTEIARLDAADGALAAEGLRIEMELTSPPRIQLLQSAEGGGDK